MKRIALISVTLLSSTLLLTGCPEIVDGGATVEIADPNLALCIWYGLGYDYSERESDEIPLTFTKEQLERLLILEDNGKIKLLDGIEYCTNLEILDLGRCYDLRSLAPLSDLTSLYAVNLLYTEVADLSPLVSCLGEGDWLNIYGCPLSEESENVHIPAMEANGVEVVSEYD